MSNPNNLENERDRAEDPAYDLKEDAAPERVGVYERPERTGPSSTWMAIIVVVLLLVAAVAIYMLVF